VLRTVQFQHACQKIAQARVQLLRCDYWEKVRDLEPENMVFLDETGVLLGLMRHYARSEKGSRVYDLKPFCGARSSGFPKV
jgi:hypothetical protein